MKESAICPSQTILVLTKAYPEGKEGLITLGEKSEPRTWNWANTTAGAFSDHAPKLYAFIHR